MAITESPRIPVVLRLPIAGTRMVRREVFREAELSVKGESGPYDIGDIQLHRSAAFNGMGEERFDAP
jgi:hypothetical protein